MNKESPDFTSHYNGKLDRCFIQTQNTIPQGDFFWRQLFDAYGGKQYGEYGWQRQKDKAHWQVPPFVCHVILPSGETQNCKSDDEFGRLARVYMEQ